MTPLIRAALSPVEGSLLLFDPSPSLVIELSRLDRVTQLVAACRSRRAARRCRDGLAGETSSLSKLVVLTAEADDAPFPATRFDALVCAGGLPPLSEPIEILEALRCLVRPGGLFLIASRIREGGVGGLSSLVRRAVRGGALPRASELTAWMLMAGMRSVRQAVAPRSILPSVLTWARVCERPWES